MVERYAATLDPDVEPLGVERTVSTRTDGLVLSGRVDRIDLRDGELVVVDYKTGQRPPTPDDAGGSLALALYALAAARALRRRSGRVELHHLPTGRVAAYDHTDASLTGHLDRAEAAAVQAADATDALAAGDDADVLFPPRTSSGCAWCDHLRACPAGQAAAGPPRRPWDGLPGEAA
jgi:RecB family exonuclease